MKRIMMLNLERVMNVIRRLSIFKRLILSFLFIILIPNLIIGYYSFNISSHEMNKSISDSTGQLLRSIRSNINGKLTLYESVADRISSNDRLRELLSKCKSIEGKKSTDAKIAQEYQQYKMQIGNILYQTASSFDISNLEILSDSDEFTERGYIDEARGGKLRDAGAYRESETYARAVAAEGAPVWLDTSRDIGVFSYQDSKVSNIQNHVTLLQCIPDIGLNKPLGMIIITVPIGTFNNLVELKNIYGQNEVLLLTGKKGVISVLNDKMFHIDMLPDEKILKEISELQVGSIIREYSGSSTIFIFDSIDKMDMSIVYAVREREIYSSVYLVRNIILEVTILCILFALLLSYFVTASISIPMNKLKRTMEKVGENGLELDYVDNQRDEIGALGYRFKAMMSRIKNLVETLINEELLRKNEEIRRKRAELDALQMQINPHFLYNTLDLIRCNAMLQENGEGEISRMISSFSNLLRFNTIKTEKLVDINEEIAHIRAYVEVLRQIKKLDLKVEAILDDPSIGNNKITKLTFQPIVENAVKYGLTSTECAGIISIHGYKNKSDVCIDICDNGEGISEERLKHLNEELKNSSLPGKSIGLRNINERIRLSFGEEYGLSIRSEEGKYTVVTIRIPDVRE